MIAPPSSPPQSQTRETKSKPFLSQFLNGKMENGNWLNFLPEGPEKMRLRCTFYLLYEIS